MFLRCSCSGSVEEKKERVELLRRLGPSPLQIKEVMLIQLKILTKVSIA